MQCTINGKETTLDRESSSLRELLNNVYPQTYQLAVELNEIFIEEHAYEQTMIKDGDRIEILVFMGGG